MSDSAFVDGLCTPNFVKKADLLLGCCDQVDSALQEHEATFQRTPPVSEALQNRNKAD